MGAPTLSIKTTGDLYTPIHLDRDYQQLVNGSGSGGNLVTRTVRRAGHCTFSELETQSALSGVLTWLAVGRPPAGEDLQGDLSGLGVAFTDPFDAQDPLRPSAAGPRRGQARGRAKPAGIIPITSPATRRSSL